MTSDRTTGNILRDSVEEVRTVLGSHLDGLEVERVVVGVFFSGVKLADGSGGVCATPAKLFSEAACCPNSASAMPLPGRLRGRPVDAYLAELFADNGIRRTLGIAVLNALAGECWRRQPSPGCRAYTGIDAFDQAQVGPDDRVVLVGAFPPLIRLLKRRGKPFRILEKNSSALKADEMDFYRPAEDAPRVVPKADVLVATGTTLVNDTLEGLLALARPDARVVVVGPTAGMLPGPYFRRGVSVLGGISVTNPNELLDVLSEGGSGYHFFGRSAEKVTLVRESAEVWG